MIKIKKNKLYKILLILLIVFANTTGILQYVGGSMFAEGIIIFITAILMFALLNDKKKLNSYDYLAMFVACYSVLITIINILLENIELKSLIGIYYYTIPMLIFLNRNNSFFKKNINLYFKLFLILLSINSIYAILQNFMPNTFIPLEFGRARGLMKTTLNFSGLIGVMFFPLIAYNVKNNLLKFFNIFIIFVGGIFSLSRGLLANLICSYILYPIIKTIHLKKIKMHFIVKHYLKIIILTILFSFILLLLLNNDLIIEKFERLFHLFDYKGDKANTIRANKWGNFTEYFITNPFGYGIGQIASGTSFVTNCVNFESYILDTFYSIGVVSLIYFSLPILWIRNILKNNKLKNMKYMYMFIVGTFIQNAVQPSMLTPTTLVITWFNFIFFTNYLSLTNKSIRRSCVK